MYPFKRAPLPSLALTVAADAGQRRYVKMEGNSFTYMVFLIISMTVTITVANATAVQNNGSGLAAFDLIGIDENGTERVVIDPRVARYLAEVFSLSGLSSNRLTTPNIGVTNLREMVPIFLSRPDTIDPGETAFREKDPTADSSVFVQLAAAPTPKLLTVGGATVVISNITVDVQQVHNRNQKNLGIYIPSIRQLTRPVAGALTDLDIPVFSDKYLSMLVITQDTASGVVNDIVNKISLRSDLRDYIGPTKEKWFNLANQAEESFGGSVTVAPSFNNGTVAPAHLALSFVDHGRLSTLIEPNETNLRITADCQPSANGAVSFIRVTLLELQRDMGTYSGPGGVPRRITRDGPLPWQRQSAKAA